MTFKEPVRKRRKLFNNKIIQFSTETTAIQNNFNVCVTAISLKPFYPSRLDFAQNPNTMGGASPHPPL